MSALSFPTIVDPMRGYWCSYCSHVYERDD